MQKLKIMFSGLHLVYYIQDIFKHGKYYVLSHFFSLYIQEPLLLIYSYIL